jgi:Spy/CpxP family protein refolding chaperone
MSLPRHLSAIALAAGLLVPVAACAQQTPGQSQPQAQQQAQPQVQQQGQPAGPGAAAPAQRHRAGLRQALKRLNLTDDQRRQIAGIMKQTRLANRTADQPTRRANNKQMRAQINGVLTADQQTQLRQTLHDMRRHGAAQPAGSNAPAAPNPS